MLSDVIAFVYEPYDKDHKYIDEQELKDFMYVSSPEDFAAKVNRISTDKEFYNHIKFLQRKAVYDKYSQFCNEKTKKIFENWLSSPQSYAKPKFATTTALW